MCNFLCLNKQEDSVYVTAVNTPYLMFESDSSTQKSAGNFSYCERHQIHLNIQHIFKDLKC